MFLVQSKLSFLEVARTSGRVSGVTYNQHIDWSEAADLGLGRHPIPTTPFDILCHIGVVIVEEEICAHTSLLLARKLLSGMIFEHLGPTMASAREAHGQSILPAFLNTILLIQCIGCTYMDD